LWDLWLEKDHMQPRFNAAQPSVSAGKHFSCRSPSGNSAGVPLSPKGVATKFR
jgi:hypothetical protein